MKTSLLAVLFFTGLISFAQTQEFNIIWDGYQSLETEFEKIKVPKSSNQLTSYSHDQGLILFKEYDSNNLAFLGAELVNPKYEVISPDQLFDLNTKTLKSQVEFQYGTTFARSQQRVLISLNPIINVVEMVSIV